MNRQESTNISLPENLQIQRLKQILSIIRSISQLTLKASDRRELLQGTCDLLTQDGGYYNVWIALPDEKGIFSETYESGLGEKFDPLKLRFEEGGNIACSKIVLNEKPFWSTDNPTKVCTTCHLSTLYSGHSAFSARLEYEEEVFGMITASVPKEFHSSEPERELFSEVADDLALALHHLKVHWSLLQSEEKYRALYDNAPLAYQALDPNRYYLDVNSTWHKMLGYTRNEVIGKPFSDFMHPDWGHGYQEKFQTFLHKGCVDDAQFRMRHKNGHHIDISLKGSIGHNPDKTIRPDIPILLCTG